MPTAQKVEQVEQIKERYQRASGVIFTEYRGLSVPALQKLRRNLAAQGADYSVVKNTLFKIAAGDDAAKISDEMTSGPTGVAFVYKDEAATAKALFDFIKENKTFVIKGGFLDGRLYDGARMEEISKLPPRDVLLSQIVGIIAAPMSNLVGTIQEIYAAPIRAIGAVADKVSEASPASPSPSSHQADDNLATTGQQPDDAPQSESTPTAEAAPEADAQTSSPEATQE